MLAVYKSATGEVFFRVSDTMGRTLTSWIKADLREELEEWLDERGFRLLREKDGEAPPAALTPLPWYRDLLGGYAGRGWPLRRRA
jgi:hypothetical protein